MFISSSLPLSLCLLGPGFKTSLIFSYQSKVVYFIVIRKFTIMYLHVFQELTYRESLHCVKTAFVILSGQGAALNIDPQRFYSNLYHNMLGLHGGQRNWFEIALYFHSLCGGNCCYSNENYPKLKNIQAFFGKRKLRTFSFQRVVSFLKYYFWSSTKLLWLIFNHLKLSVTQSDTTTN